MVRRFRQALHLQNATAFNRAILPAVNSQTPSGRSRLLRVAVSAALGAWLAWSRGLEIQSSLAAPADDVHEAQSATPTASSPRRILFIGNSLTFWHDGVYSHLEKLAASANAPETIETAKCVKGGATLKVQWERPEPRAMIAQGGWTDVVVQEDLPEINVSYFREHARHFVEEIRKAKARPVLLMTWAYARLDWIDNDQIAGAHRVLARELDVEVAPVALAWETVLRDRPTLDLFAADREHPSLGGTYLETCVVYATLTHRCPEPLSYVPAGITAGDAAYLRQVAWKTVQSWKP